MEDRMIGKEEFNECARQVTDAYPDFVNGLYSCAKSAGCVSLVYDFMRKNRDADTGQILEVIDDALGNPDPMKVRSSQKGVSHRSLVAA